MICAHSSAPSRALLVVSRSPHAATTTALLLFAMLAGCSDSTSSPPSRVVPDFIYVSNQNGSDQLFTYHDGTTTIFPGSIAGDHDPQSAAGKVVFSGFRDGSDNAEIYSATVSGTEIARLTNSAGTDQRPSLSPDGTKIIFVSLRTGVSRLWLMGSDGSNPTEFATGTDEFTPETSPKFSPDGVKFLYSSSGTGISQIFSIPVAGGAPTQVTHEVNGAFDGAWSSDGNSIFYVDGSDRTKVHKIVIASGDVSDYVTDATDVGQPACNSTMCLVTSGATRPPGDIWAYFGAGDANPILVIHTNSNEKQPAILHP